MGGNCSKQNPIQGVNDPNIKIGETRVIQQACGYAGTEGNSLNRYIPKNGEYEFVGNMGTCHFCGTPPTAMTCSTGCAKSGCCAIVGNKGGYRRTSYKADPLQCRLAQTATMGNLTYDQLEIVQKKVVDLI